MVVFFPLDLVSPSWFPHRVSHQKSCPLCCCLSPLLPCCCSLQNSKAFLRCRASLSLSPSSPSLLPNLAGSFAALSCFYFGISSLDTAVCMLCTCVWVCIRTNPDKIKWSSHMWKFVFFSSCFFYQGMGFWRIWTTRSSEIKAMLKGSVHPYSKKHIYWSCRLFHATGAFSKHVHYTLYW